MIIIFNQDGTLNLTCDSLGPVKNFIESTNLPYLETNESIDFSKYKVTLVDNKLVKTEITEIPVLE